MSDYTTVSKELERGTPAEVLCATCPWDRLCVTPPSMTREEIDRKLAEAESQDSEKPTKDGMPVRMLMTAIALGGRDTAGQLCPVFALRLRGPDGRQVADGIRSLMRDHVTQEDPS